MAEKIDERFKEIAARYCSVKAEDITNDMSFRDDLGLSSNSISVRTSRSCPVYRPSEALLKC